MITLHLGPQNFVPIKEISAGSKVHHCLPCMNIYPRIMLNCGLNSVKISPRMSQKRLRFGDDVGKREFIKFAKKYHQQLEEECASVGRVTKAKDASRD